MTEPFKPDATLADLIGRRDPVSLKVPAGSLASLQAVLNVIVALDKSDTIDLVGKVADEIGSRSGGILGGLFLLDWAELQAVVGDAFGVLLTGKRLDIGESVAYIDQKRAELEAGR